MCSPLLAVPKSVCKVPKRRRSRGGCPGGPKYANKLEVCPSQGATSQLVGYPRSSTSATEGANCTNCTKASNSTCRSGSWAPYVDQGLHETGQGRFAAASEGAGGIGKAGRAGRRFRCGCAGADRQAGEQGLCYQIQELTLIFLAAGVFFVK